MTFGRALSDSIGTEIERALFGFTAHIRRARQSNVTALLGKFKYDVFE